MYIKSIELENFRQFKGKQSIDFSIEEDKTVTVILGQNTGGKTTLVRAFAWCLYGGTPEEMGFKKNSLLLNTEIQVDMEKDKSQTESTVKVSLVVNSVHGLSEDSEDKNALHQYRIERSQKYYKDSKNQVFAAKEQKMVIYSQKMQGDSIDPSDNEEMIQDKKRINEIINSIMPKELSEYFFYWGEKIENIGKKTDIDKAIEIFTGLDVYSHAVKHVATARDNLTNAIVISSGKANLHELLEKKKREETRLSGLERQLQTAKDGLKYYQEQKDKADQEYFQIRDEEKQVERRKELLSDKNRLEAKSEIKNGQFLKQFNNKKSSIFFVQKKASELLDMVKENQNEKQDIGWSNITVSAINEILEKGVCVCGRKLSDHPEAIKHLKEQEAYALPNALGGYISKIESIYTYASKDAFNYVEQLKNDYVEYDEVMNEIKSVESELEDLARQNIDPEEFERRKQNRIQAEENLGQAHNKKGAIEEQINQAKDNIKNLAKEIDAESAKENRGQLLRARKKLAERVLETIKKQKNEQSEEMRNELRSYTQNYLNQIYKGKRFIEITNGFRIKVKNEVNGIMRENETSPGLETVKNFAFVAALITIAKDVAAKKNESSADSEGASEPYPLVLDAPFSQTDEEHVLNICKLITQVAEQTILVMMEKDWNIANRILGSSVGKYYVINKKSETYSVIGSGV